MSKDTRVGVDLGGGLREAIEECRDSILWKESSLATKTRTLLLERLEILRTGGTVREQSDSLELLMGFIRYLAENLDHDGYSLSEISKLLGMPDDRQLVEMVQILQAAKAAKAQQRSNKPRQVKQ